MSHPTSHESFGDSVPYGDPNWYQKMWHSPYYNKSHEEFRKKCRSFVEQEVIPNVEEWERQKSIPNSVNQKAAKLGI